MDQTGEENKMDGFLKTLQEWLQTWQGMTVLAAATLTFLLKVLRYRERSWSFSSRKKKRLRQLFEGRKWRKAAAFDLDAALTDAFGKSVTGVELAFIETRDRPLRLLEDRLRAGGGVKWRSPTGDGWDDARPAFMKKISPSTTSGVCSGLASLTLVAGTGLTVMSCLNAGPFAGIMVATNSVLLFVGFFMAALSQDAAQRVIDLEKYPRAQPIPPRTNKQGKLSKDDGSEPDVPSSSPLA